MQARLDKYPTLKMSSAKLLNEFPQPQVAARREGVSIEEYRKEQQEKQQAANRQLNAAMGDQPTVMPQVQAVTRTGPRCRPTSRTRLRSG